ncbi:LysR family transcriptional regulator [Pseudoduganella chitinolytica]|uniref:LysR family transcriptional regulator n=1 Tax=Pseudoduganella chitinolytica TaxID=34070 RepID=A0ABY8BGM2_9BURK|nr:LysR family transcriptional regulator [Pseudoduganella chitinolytica]WEF34826.1 LysR family transcriptional regulator [Pseudoduganella chitinolytica]
MADDFDWNDIPLVLALARSGSMSAAGRHLGVDTSTISRRVAAAEKSLNLRLFIRETTGYRLTDAGQVFVERGEAVYGNVQSMLLASTREAETIAGTVRISAIDFLFDHWLVRHVGALCARHPALEVNLVADNDNVSFARREADFALRLAPPADDAAVLMRWLGEIGWAVYGAPAFADVPREAWGGQPWIAPEEALSHVPEMRWLARLAPRPRQPLRVNGLSTMVSACRAGVGMALLPCIVGEDEGLLRLSGTEVTRELWLLSHRDAVSIGRFKLVAAWLAQLFDDSRAALCGAAR